MKLLPLRLEAHILRLVVGSNEGKAIVRLPLFRGRGRRKIRMLVGHRLLGFGTRDCLLLTSIPHFPRNPSHPSVKIAQKTEKDVQLEGNAPPSPVELEFHVEKNLVVYSFRL